MKHTPVLLILVHMPLFGTVATLFKAQTVITMNPAQSEANAVVVKEGKVLAVGSYRYLKNDYPDIPVNRQFQGDVMVPGFIEAHMHPQIAGFFWQYVYVGHFDRVDPNGHLMKGCTTKQDVLDRIADAVHKQQHKDGWVIAWGYQSEFYRHEPLTVDELDPIGGEYKLCVENANMHALYANSHALASVGVTVDTPGQGIGKKDGRLTGSLLEYEAMSLLLKHLPEISFDDMCRITRMASRLAHRVGVTTMADAAYGFSFLTHGLEAYRHEVPKENFAQRVAFFPINGLVKSKGIAYIKQLQKQNTDKLWVDAVKFLTDGSLQCHTAHLQWPFYHHCSCNGMENIPLEDLKEQWQECHNAGLRAAIHVNGNQAIEQALQAAQAILDEHPRLDHRHSFEHNQMVTEEQLQRMQRLGINANFFVNHIYYWGDIHIENLGYIRAARLNPLASALRHQVRFSLHSDASVTPVDPLFCMWVATNRLRYSGKPLGKSQRISTYAALKAVTLDAAHLLRKDDVLGSIEVGKYADFTILDKDPLQVPTTSLKDIKVKATVLGGRIMPIASEQWCYVRLSEACKKLINKYV